MLWCTIPFRSEGLILPATRSVAGRKPSVSFRGLLRLKVVASSQAAPTTPQHKGIKGPALFSNSRWLQRVIPSVFSTEAASKLYLSLCSVLLPFLPFFRDSFQEHSLINHLLDNLHLRACFPENPYSLLMLWDYLVHHAHSLNSLVIKDYQRITLKQRLFFQSWKKTWGSFHPTTSLNRKDWVYTLCLRSPC